MPDPGIDNPVNCDEQPDHPDCQSSTDIDPGTDPGGGGGQPPDDSAGGGTEEDPGTDPGGGSEPGDGDVPGGGSQQPPGSGGGGCESEPALTGQSDSTSDPTVTLGTPTRVRFGNGIKAVEGSVVEIKSPIIIGCNRRGVEARRGSTIVINGALIRGAEYGIISSVNSTVRCAYGVVCRTGAVHAEHAATIMFGGFSLSKNNRRNTSADGSFFYAHNSTFETTRFSGGDKAYNLLVLNHLRGELNSSFETSSSTILKGNLGTSNIVLNNDSQIEGSPTVV